MRRGAPELVTATTSCGSGEVVTTSFATSYWRLCFSAEAPNIVQTSKSLWVSATGESGNRMTGSANKELVDASSTIGYNISKLGKEGMGTKTLKIRGFRNRISDLLPLSGRVDDGHRPLTTNRCLLSADNGQQSLLRRKAGRCLTCLLAERVKESTRSREGEGMVWRGRRQSVEVHNA
nr:hypothetical protein Iba_chr10aCG11580 [Ipomoea batatas]